MARNLQTLFTYSPNPVEKLAKGNKEVESDSVAVFSRIGWTGNCTTSFGWQLRPCYGHHMVDIQSYCSDNFINIFNMQFSHPKCILFVLIVLFCSFFLPKLINCFFIIIISFTWCFTLLCNNFISLSIHYFKIGLSDSFKMKNCMH